MRHRLTPLILHLCIFFVLAYGYENAIVPLYGYEGYVFQPNIANGYLALTAVVVLSLMTPIAFQKPSTIFYQFTFVLVLIPILVLFYAEDKQWEYPAQVVIAYIFSVFFRRFVKITPPRFSFVSEEMLQRILLFILSGYIAVVLLMGGGAYLNFDFSKVYDFRSDAASNLPGVFGYISHCVEKVAIPIGLVLSLRYKKYLITLLYLGFAFLIFGLTSNKGTLFNPILVLFIYPLTLKKNLTVIFNVAVLIVLILSIADLWMVMNDPERAFGWLGAVMLARTFFVPNEINYMYYDFFSRNEWVFFADSKITFGLIDYNYPLDISHLIGREYFNSDHAGANTGWFGSGYAHAGFAGMLLYAAVAAAIFKYVDACARNLGERALVTAAIIIPISSMITSSDLPTTLLTHGLALNLILIACLRGRRTQVADPLPRRSAIGQRLKASRPYG